MLLFINFFLSLFNKILLVIKSFYLCKHPISFLLLHRYTSSKNKFTILGKTSRKNFYYWAAFSKNKIKVFTIRRSKLFLFRFTQFYFSPSIEHLRKKRVIKCIICLRKKISFLKKVNNIDKNILFRVGSRSWKKNIFRKKSWLFFNKFLTKKTTPTNSIKSPKANNYKFVKSVFSKRKKIKPLFNAKFKFQRVIYNNRLIFQHFFNFKKMRQHKFTKYFNSFFKSSFTKLILKLEFSLINILIRSKFVFSKENANILINKNIVFVNGYLCQTSNKSLNVGDRVQLLLTKNYYYYFRRFLSSAQQLKKKVGPHIWRLTRFLSNMNKQIPTNIHKWIPSLKYYRIDVPRYLEVDYVFLACIIIYKPMFLFEYNYYNVKYINFNLMRLYSWKYLT